MPTDPTERRLIPDGDEGPTRAPVSIEGSPQAIQIAVAPATAALDVRDLLHSRLKTLALISLCSTGVFNVLRFLRLDFTLATILSGYAPAVVYLSAASMVLLYLRVPRARPIAQLRFIEGVFFGLTALYFVSENLTTLIWVDGWLRVYAQRHPAELSILAREPSVMWMAVIIAYGTFIPNTGPRCAVFVLAIAVMPLVAIAAAGVLVLHLGMRPLFLFLSEMTLWLGIAVALAVYGSIKIERLREQAVEARKLGQYQITRRLGQGGMGTVYLAEHMLLRRPCAVKVIRPEYTGDPTAMTRFMREVQLTATLSHPNTVQVYDYGRAADGTLFYAMEYLTGLTLDELVRTHGPMPSSRVVFVLRQLCGALSEAHGVGLIHRDIKPSNVILCCRGGMYDVAKLLDFGLARMQSLNRAAAEMTQAGLIFGTPTYMSPEQAAGLATLTPQCDLYSLGALAFFLLAGTPPFVRDTVVQTLAAHLHDRPVPVRDLRPDVPPEVDAIVARCLEKDPSARFAGADSLLRALDACPLSDAWTPSEAADWWAQIDGKSENARHPSLS